MADEPTLRRGDQSADGWVEYLQTQLKAKTDLHLPTLVEVTGKFDEVTLGRRRAPGVRGAPEHERGRRERDVGRAAR